MMSFVGYNAPFNWDTLPLTTWSSVSLVVLIYLAVIYSIENRMRYRKVGLSLTKVVEYHNRLLCFGSTILFVPMSAILLQKYMGRGLMYMLCSPRMLDDPRLLWLYYYNYLFKLYELLDTVLLALRKKPLKFLHVYHHCATLVLCFTQLEVCRCAETFFQQWLPIVINLFVHVIMYHYYAQVAAGVTVWWKEWVTRIQIAQFVIDVIACWFAILSNYLYKPCAGDIGAGFFGAALLSSYLYLFVDFYRKTYNANEKSNSSSILASNKVLAREHEHST